MNTEKLEKELYENKGMVAHLSHIYDTIKTYIKFLEDGRDVHTLVNDNERNVADISRLEKQLKEIKESHEKVLKKVFKQSKDRKKRLDTLHS